MDILNTIDALLPAGFCGPKH